MSYFELPHRIASILHKNLDHYRPVEIARVTQTLMVLHYQSPDLYNRLKTIMLRWLSAPRDVDILDHIT